MNIGEIVKIIIIPLSLLIFGIIYKINPSLKKDNQVEEVVEHAIKQVTGQDIDLSPDTPDKCPSFTPFEDRLDQMSITNNLTGQEFEAERDRIETECYLKERYGNAKLDQ